MKILGKSKMNRRAMLKASGICMALPWMESLANSTTLQTPKRFCSIYFPYGGVCPIRKANSVSGIGSPQGEGKNFTFNKSLEPLNKFRDQVTVLGGLCHPKVKRIGGHDSGDTFLTGEEMSLKANGLKNSISLDQFMAHTHRLWFRNQVLNSGSIFRWWHRHADPGKYAFFFQTPVNPFLPSIVQRSFFERLFGLSGESIDAQRKGLSQTGSHLDLFLDDAKSMHRKLGKTDQDKLDQYLTSVREIGKGCGTLCPMARCTKTQS